MCHIFGIVYGKHININTTKFYFPLTKIFEIIKHFWQNNTCAQLFGTRITLLYNYSFLSNFSSVQRHSLVLPKKNCLNFRRTHPLAFFFKNGFNKNFGVPYSSTFAGLLGKLKTTRLERLTFILDVRKEVCLRNITCLQRRVHVITYLIWWSRN